MGPLTHGVHAHTGMGLVLALVLFRNLKMLVGFREAAWQISDKFIIKR